MSRFSLAFSIFLISIITNAQNTSGGKGSMVLSPAVQFLEVAPDSRSAGMGNTGVASSPDIYSMYWNPAKLAWLDQEYGVSISYTPWLKQLVNDMWIGYLNGYMKLSKEDALGVSLQYFDLGKLELRDDQGTSQGDYNPREMAAALTYSRILTRELSIAGSVKYVNSNLSSPDFNSVGAAPTKPGRTAAVDVGTYWKKEDVRLGKRLWNTALGLTLSNLGGKISYTNEANAQQIPTNLRLGGSLGTDIDQFNKIDFNLDFNSLLIGRKDTSYSFSEELGRVTTSVGAEYTYADAVMVRAGYFHETQKFGNRRFGTVGFGLKYNDMTFDFAYLIPITRNSPLQNTIRFSLGFYFRKAKQNQVDSVVE